MIKRALFFISMGLASIIPISIGLLVIQLLWGINSLEYASSRDSQALVFFISWMVNLLFLPFLVVASHTYEKKHFNVVGEIKG